MYKRILYLLAHLVVCKFNKSTFCTPVIPSYAIFVLNFFWHYALQFSVLTFWIHLKNWTFDRNTNWFFTFQYTHILIRNVNFVNIVENEVKSMPFVNIFNFNKDNIRMCFEYKRNTYLPNITKIYCYWAYLLIQIPAKIQQKTVICTTFWIMCVLLAWNDIQVVTPLTRH